MRENKVVYGLIGYGGMGRWHTEILSNVSEAVIGGIYDIKKEKREEAKEKGFFVYETEEAMLADPDIDVVLIATPNDCHKPIAIRAMHAGKNVISEKPVTLSSADLLEMENAAKETGKVVTVEEHSVIGGLGSAVCDALAEKAPTPVKKIGIQDVFGESGPAVELIKKYGLDADSIYEKVKAFAK